MIVFISGIALNRLLNIFGPWNFYLWKEETIISYLLQLDLECPPKTNVFKAWSAGWHYWKVVWSLSVIGSVPLKGTVKHCPFLFLSSFTFSHDMNSFARRCTSCYNNAALPLAQSNRANQLWTGTSETMGQSTFFLLWVISGICYSNIKLTTKKWGHCSTWDNVENPLKLITNIWKSLEEWHRESLKIYNSQLFWGLKTPACW